MTIPTCFEDLDWSENAKPTSAHFLALIMAYRERASLQEPNAFPILDCAYPPATQPYNAISLSEIKYFIHDLTNQVDLLRNLNDEFMEEKGDITYEENLAFFITGMYWQIADTDFYIEEEHSKKLENVDNLDEYNNLKVMMASTDEFLMAHRYKEIDQQALMRFLIKHKNFVGKLTELYCEIGSLGVNRPQYYIDWETSVEADKPSSFQSAQQRKDIAGKSVIEAFWYYDKGEGDDGWEGERLYFDCNDCDIPYIFKYPAVVSVHCWEERTTNYEPDDSWYYDFGTGLQLGWNNLGTHNLGERIPLLPQQGWGDAKATAVPPKRGAKGHHYCSWGIDLIKFDFYNSLKFKVPRDA